MQPITTMTRGNFILGDMIGSGASGTVYRGWIDNGPCAAKAINLTQSEIAQATIQNEIAIQSNLRHRHIIQFYETHKHDDGRTYLIMDLAEQGSLAHYIDRIGLSDWDTRLRLADEMARGLEYMHRHNILHLDLKSANVLLTKHMDVKLADFGLSTIKTIAASKKKTVTESVKGTLRWMAPELLGLGCRQVPEYTTKSDMFALGIVMWEMAANCTRPFKHELDDHKVMSLVRSGQREVLPEDTPAEYSDLVKRCWNQDPALRPEAREVILWDNEPISEPSSPGGEYLSGLSTGFSQGTLSIIAQETTDHSHLLHYTSAQADLDALQHKEDLRNSSPEDQFQYAELLFLDPTDKKLEALTWYREAADHGHAGAQFKLGTLYLLGFVISQSDTEAMAWFLKAAQQNHLEAIVRLGQAYTDGRGVEKNDLEAASWFFKAAARDSPMAQFCLGQMYDEGRGVVQCDREAARWYGKAATKGHLGSQELLSRMYAEGRGVKQNDRMADWLLQQVVDTYYADVSYQFDDMMSLHDWRQERREGALPPPPPPDAGVVPLKTTMCHRSRSERKKKASVAKPRRDQAEGTTKARGIRRSHSDVPRLFHKTAWRHDPEASNLFMRAMMEAEERFEQGPMGSFAAWKSHQPLK